MAGIFVSYRRSDSDSVTEEISRWLEQRLPAGYLFLDTRSIPPGKEFDQVIVQTLTQAHLLLAVIGPDWIGERVTTTRAWFGRRHRATARRLDDPNDYVRLEIELAIQYQIPIIPLLIRGLTLADFGAMTLPESLAKLKKYNAMPVRGEPDFASDMERLALALPELDRDLYVPRQRPIPRIIHLPTQRNQYLHAIGQRYQHLALPTGDVTLDLNDIYQPLRLHSAINLAERQREGDRLALLDESRRGDDDERRQVPDGAGLHRVRHQPGDHTPTVQEQNAANGEDALQKSPSRRLVVLGTPGSGKTTLLQSIVVHRAAAALQDPTLPMPILLSLPQLARAKAWQEAALQHVLADTVGDLRLPDAYASALMTAITTGNVVLCLDGLDEVAPGARQEIIRWINNLPAPTAQGAIIIGSRFTEYKGGELKQGQYFEWVLKALDDTLRQQLAHKLLPKLAPHGPPSLADDFLAALQSHPRASNWGNNPLLFTLAAYVYATYTTRHPEASAPQLPAQRVELYGTIIDAILANPSRRTESSDAGLLITSDIFAGVALTLFRTTGRTFGVREITDALRVWCPQFGITDQGLDEKYQRLLNSGLLEVVASKTYGFRHLTFQEYLAAAGLARMLTSTSESASAWEVLRAKATRSRWAEVLRLTIGVLGQTEAGLRVAKQWFQELLNPPGGDPGFLYLALALRSLTELGDEDLIFSLGQPIMATWIDHLFSARRQGRTRIAERLLGLTPELAALPTSLTQDTRNQLVAAMQDDDWRVRETAVQALAALNERSAGAEVEILIVAVRDSTGAVRIPAVKALGAMGERLPEAGMAALIASLRDRDETVRQEAIQALGAIGMRLPEVAITALIASVGYGDWKERQMAAQALGALGARLPEEGIAALIERLQDFDEDVRAVVAQALAAQGERIPAERWLRMLTESDWVSRHMAIEALGALGERLPAEGITAIVTALHDEEPAVRVMAARAMASLGDRFPADGMTALITALHDDKDDVRAAAARALGALGDHLSANGLAALIAALGDARYNVRRAAVQALGTLGEGLSTEGMSAVIAALRDSDTDVQKFAALALGAQSERLPEAGILALIAALRDKTYNVRAAAAQALSTLGERLPQEGIVALSEVLHDYYTDVRRAAAQALAAQGERISAERWRSLLTGTDWQVRQGAIQALRALGDQIPDAGIAALLAALHDSDSHIREDAAWALIGLGERVPDEGVIALIAAVRDSYSGVRRMAVFALGRQGKRVSDDGLRAIIFTMNEDWVVQNATKWTLRALGTRWADGGMRLLIAILRDSDAHMRLAAVRAMQVLGEQVPEDGLLALAPLLSDSHHEVPREAIKTLGEQIERLPVAAVTALINALHHDDWQVREAAIQALSGLGTRLSNDVIATFIAALDDAQWHVRVGAARALGTVGERLPQEGMAALITTVHDDDTSDVRQAAALALAALGERLPAEGMTALIAALRDSSAYTRAPVAKALGTLGALVPAEGVAALLAALDDSESSVRLAAAQALVTLGNQPAQAALATLVAALQDDDFEVRKAAVNAMGSLGERLPEAGLMALLAAMRDRLGDVRVAVVVALRTLGQWLPEAGKIALLGALHDGYWSARDEAIKALSTLDSQGVPLPHGWMSEWMNAAIAALEDPPWNTGEAAAKALGALGERLPPEGVSALIRAVRSGGFSDRSSALDALAAWGKPLPEDGMAVVIAALCDDDINVRRSAADVLRPLHIAPWSAIYDDAMRVLQGHPPASFFLPFAHLLTAKSIGDIGRPIPPFLALLDEWLGAEDWGVRLHTANALGKIRRGIPDQTIRRLETLWQDPSQPRPVHNAAEDALDEILSVDEIEDDD